ncbi:hypothetical protein ABK040_007256 [Willaertia magna]
MKAKPTSKLSSTNAKQTIMLNRSNSPSLTVGGGRQQQFVENNTTTNQQKQQQQVILTKQVVEQTVEKSSSINNNSPNNNENDNNNKALQEEEEEETTNTTTVTTTTTTTTKSTVETIRIGNFPHPPEHRHSVLEAKGSEGFLNLAGLLLLTWSANQMYNNYRKNGYPLDLTLLFQLLRGIDLMMFLWLTITIYTLFTSVILEFIYTQKSNTKSTANKASNSGKASKGNNKAKLLDYTLCTVYAVAQIVLFTMSTYISFTSTRLSGLCRLALAAQTCVNSFKMHSYFVTCRYFREDMIYGGKYVENDFKPIFNNQFEKTRVFTKSKFKQFLELCKDYIYFIRIPSLVYEIEFPKKDKISFRYVAREYGGGLICCLVIYIIIQKYIAPIIGDIDKYNWYDIAVNLSLPSLSIWLIIFYCVFHCFLNGTAELAYYNDRDFYLNWWDATTVSQFWKLWNRAVFKFMTRHIYVESQRRVKGFNKVLAALSTFFVTAVLHEYVLILTFRVVRPYFFAMIISQIPLFYVTELLKGNRVGNALLWFGFLIAFPFLELLYFREALRIGSL